jgi:hypothetical protein
MEGGWMEIDFYCCSRIMAEKKGSPPPVRKSGGSDY